MNEPFAREGIGGSSETDHLGKLQTSDMHLVNACGNKQSSTPIIIDSGCTAHMMPYKDLILNGFKDAGGKVMLGNSKTLNIRGIGNSSIKQLNNVLWVPSLNIGLISISMLDKQGCKTDFNNGKCIVYNNAQLIILRATLRNRLYYLDKEYIETISISNNNYHVVTPISLDVSEANKANKINDSNTSNEEIQSDKYHENVINNYNATITNHPLIELHKAWGHLSEKYIKRALREDMVIGCKYTYNDIKDYDLGVCLDCMKGRMKAQPSGSLSDTVWQVLEKIGVDYKGPFRVKSIHHYNGFIIFSDNNSNFINIVLVKDKRDVNQALERYHNEVIVKHNKVWKILQCDYDTIFNSDKVRRWLRQKNIQLNISQPYVHSMNGQVERDVCSIMDKARTLMASGNVPIRYWEYAVLFACYIINRTPSANMSITPYEAVI